MSEKLLFLHKIKQMQDRQYKIYCLKHPITNEIRYIGVTVNTIAKRYSQHLSDVKKRPQLHKSKWINFLLKENLKPIIEIIEICDESNWEEREIYWIKKYKEEGLKLTNILPGGKGIVLTKKQGNGNSKPVYKYDINGNYIESFKSASEAAKSINVKNSSIGRVLSGARGTCGGFQWSYIKFDKLDIYRNPQHYRIKCYKMVPVFYKEFNSLQETMREMNITFDLLNDSISKKMPKKGFLYEKV